jgi:hypothetical protein
MGDDAAVDKSNEPRPSLNLPWPWLSAGLAVVAVAALGTAAVVAGTKNADTLSTIALALAILAFAAQLILALAQGMSGAQQVAQVERVNADTQAALSALRAASDALLSTQRDQFGEVLRAAIARAVPEAVDSTIADDEVDAGGIPSNESLKEAIVESLDAALASRMASLPSTAARSSRPAPTERFRTLASYPAEGDGAEAVDIFKGLTPWEAQRLSRFGVDAKRRAGAGRSTGIWMRQGIDLDALGPANTALRSKGLLSFEDRNHPDGKARVWADLTDRGVEVARLVTGDGPIPNWLKDAMSAP